MDGYDQPTGKQKYPLQPIVSRWKRVFASARKERKKKFDVYPSAYANAWLVREYKKRGGTYA